MTATTIERFEVTVGPFTFQARRAGPVDGRPVILLHGVPQTSACWTFAMEALAAAGHHAIAFTQRGYSPGARVETVTIASVPHPAAFANAYRDSLADGASGQHERSGYMRQINTLPRAGRWAMFNADTMRMRFAELPEAHVDEYVEVLGSPEAMRGVLDWLAMSWSDHT